MRLINSKKNLFLLLLYLAFLLLFAAAQEHIGRVVGVSDGDTLTIIDNRKQQIKVRLAEIDTPESAQPYGTRAKQALSQLVYGKTVWVKVRDIDRYGRTVGRVYEGDIDVNAEMVRIGAAWVYRKYASDQNLYTLEKQARQNKSGLWSLPEAQQVPPWEWRKIRR
ncbi:MULTISPECIES: thermonuclease family protein [Nitrosomonas]|uniref:Micrococcal nuclease n=1 Tax=Nitrosomonas communis TaxID=44574 RepID=A0A5D3Y7C9_9PROT|nr:MULTISPECIES: thermonuclease family protein [Nitrosomonas]TYP75792.1 micrococcal nuclease [Nitrosomonas communis]UVS60590.1 thermonuclease family protein [Nitrosomonas sp. PLL12]